MKAFEPNAILRRVCSTIIRFCLLAGLALSGYVVTNTIRDLLVQEPEYEKIEGNRILWEISTRPLSWGTWGKIENFNAQIRDWRMEGPTPWEQLYQQFDEVTEQERRGEFDYLEGAKRKEVIEQRIWNKYPPSREGFAKHWPGSWRNWIMLAIKYPVVPSLPVVAVLGLLVLPVPQGQSRWPRLPEGTHLGVRIVHFLLPVGAERLLRIGGRLRWDLKGGIVGFTIMAPFIGIVFSYCFNAAFGWEWWPWIGTKEYLLFSGYVCIPLALVKLASPEVEVFGGQKTYVCVENARGNEFRTEERRREISQEKSEGKLTLDQAQEILGVTNDTPFSEVTAIWKKLSQIYHPDARAGFDGRMKEINQAYQLIKDDIGD